MEQWVSRKLPRDRPGEDYGDAGGWIDEADQERLVRMSTERVLGISPSGRWDVGGRGWPWRVAGLVAAMLLAGVLGSRCAFSAERQSFRGRRLRARSSSMKRNHWTAAFANVAPVRSIPGNVPCLAWSRTSRSQAFARRWKTSQTLEGEA